MIIRRLELKNIRSYREAVIDFPLGRTLFEGDVGSGKSTILMAIEFAFFGLGSAKASSLLRLGEKEGAVELVFEVKRGEYSITRNLVKKGTVIQQADGALRGPSGEENLSPSELKERVLEILNFREPADPKSRSLIYQYAIYTPQEEVRQVISLRPDLRLQILRRAFRVEDYKLAAENAREVLAAMEKRVVALEAETKDIQGVKDRIAKLTAKMTQEEAKLKALELEERDRALAYDALVSEREALHKVELLLVVVRAEERELLRKISDASAELDEIDKERRRLESRVRELSDSPDTTVVTPTEMSQEQLRKSIGELRAEITRYTRAGAELQVKITQYQSVVREGKCPVCDREAASEDFVERIGVLQGEESKERLHLEHVARQLENCERLLEARRDYDFVQQRAKEDATIVDDLQRQLLRRRERSGALRRIIDESTRDKTTVEARLKDLQEEERSLTSVSSKLDAAHTALRWVREEKAASRADLKNTGEQLESLEEVLRGKERLRKDVESLNERKIWLQDYFGPTLETIERHVMMAINQEFNLNFQRWFNILVDDNSKEARVDEDFTPIVEQDGFEQDVDFLSGGERTGVALAYRLALSQMVQKITMEGERTALVLDEPTDGFSKEQLGKMREILDEIDNPQVIMVSHERELESFADQIYRLTKVNGESKITS